MERQGVERRFFFACCSIWRLQRGRTFHMKLATSDRDASVSGVCKLLVAVVNNVTGMTTPSKGVMAST